MAKMRHIYASVRDLYKELRELYPHVSAAELKDRLLNALEVEAHQVIHDTLAGEYETENAINLPFNEATRDA